MARTSNPSPNTNASAVLSVRIPLHLREALSDKCEKEGVPLVQFIRDCTEAYLEDRLRIVPGPGAKPPSYFEHSGN